MDAQAVVTVCSWRVRAGVAVDHRVDTVRACDLEGRLQRLWQARKHADAWVGHPTAEEDELVGEVWPIPETGRLVWWCVRPDPADTQETDQ